MVAVKAEYPVMIYEPPDAITLGLVESAEEMLILVDEFADIINRFAGWDAKCRPLRLAEFARRRRGPDRYNLQVDDVDDSDTFWQLVDEVRSLVQCDLGHCPVDAIRTLEKEVLRRHDDPGSREATR